MQLQCSFIGRTSIKRRVSSRKKLCLLQQNFWRDKWRNNFVTTNMFLPWQNMSFKLCHGKNMFVVTKVSLLQQNFCCDKRVKGFVTASILLWRQKRYFVATKMILEAALANDNVLHWIVPKVQAWQRSPWNAALQCSCFNPFTTTIPLENDQ